MPLHFGPGPVFIHESIAATRRWQLYAMRSLFVLGLLFALAAVLCVEMDAFKQSQSIQALAALGESFYYAIATVQLALVLLVAPAATAGTICVDRARSHRRPLPVARHHLRSTNQQLALVPTIEAQIVPCA